MLSDAEFQAWCDRLQLSQQQRDLVNQIRTSLPVRKVTGSSRNVHGPYASKKMGRTIQFESHTVELPAIVQFYENDDSVLEYWDQPIKFTVKCSPQGKQATIIAHYPDFFVMRKNRCGFEEWKTEKKLETLSEKQPYRYQNLEGKWVDVIVQEYVENLGYYYSLRSDSEIDWVKYRNQKYLQPYKQGYLAQQYILDELIEFHIKEIIINNPGINLTNLLKKAENATIDDINTLIALEKVYVDLSAVALVEQERVHLFRDQATAVAYITATHDYSEPVSSSVQIVDLKVGSSFLLDGKSLTIDHIGESKIILKGEQGIIRWTHAEFQQLVELGEISHLKTKEQTTLDEEGWQQYFIEASPKALEIANQRYQAIKPLLDGDSYDSLDCNVPERTLRQWKAKYRKAKQEHGVGLVGLIVHTYFGTSKSLGRDKTAAEYVRLAQATGGHSFRNQNAIGGFAEILKTVICSTRNRNTTPQLVPVIPVYFVQAQHLVGFSATSTQSSTSSTTQNKPVDLVIVIDTSVSMKDEAEALSNAAEAAIKKASSSCPSDLRVEWFGLEGTWKNTNFQQTLREYLINNCTVAESEIRGRKRGEVPGGGAQEDGARAIEDISTHFNWRDGASRAIFYLSDEALEGGGDTEQEDIEAANRAIEKAKNAGAIVHTYFGTSKSKGRDKTAAEYARVAQETGGQAFTDRDALGGFAEILTQIICVSSDSQVAETGQLIPVVPLYFAAIAGGAVIGQSTQMSTVQPTNPNAIVVSNGGLFSLAAPNVIPASQSSISTTAMNMPIYMMAVQPTFGEAARGTSL